MRLPLGSFVWTNTALALLPLPPEPSSACALCTPTNAVAPAAITRTRAIRRFIDPPSRVLSFRASVPGAGSASRENSGVSKSLRTSGSPRGVAARVASVLRRTNGSLGASGDEPITLTTAEIDVDLRGRTVRVAGTEIALTPREFDLLVFLMRRPDDVFPRSELLERVWGY